MSAVVRNEAAIAANVLGRAPPRPAQDRPQPPVSILLDLDRHYVRLAESGALRKISPHRFNPTGRAWLPIWHTERDDWHFHVLFSNTARAHELNKIGDWVIVHYARVGVEGQATIVTEWHGELAGCRVVRGRESECLAFYHRPVRPEVRSWTRRVLDDLAS